MVIKNYFERKGAYITVLTNNTYGDDMINTFIQINPLSLEDKIDKSLNIIVECI